MIEVGGLPLIGRVTIAALTREVIDRRIGLMTGDAEHIAGVIKVRGQPAGRGVALGALTFKVIGGLIRRVTR